MERNTSPSLKSNVRTKELVITRTFGAPRELVWKAWTEPKQMMRWWGPKGFTSPAIKIDLRPGGEFLGCMRSPDGKDYWSKGTYREIEPPERLVVTDSFADKKGNTVSASFYGMKGDWPLEMLITVTLTEEDGKTKLILEHSGVEGIAEADLSDMKQGWSESLDKLSKILAKN